MTSDTRQNLLQLFGTALIGLAAGLAAVLFHHAMVWLAGYLVTIPSAWGGWHFAVFVIISMAVGAGLTGLMISRLAPDAPGSGIPQVKAAYHNGQLDFTWKLILVKFVGGALSIGSGSSLGREGPTIHIGAAIASKVANLLGEDKAAKSNAICAGSAAGLAAAFGSPLAGVTLVLEEIAGGKNQNKFAGRSLLAAALAAYVVSAMTNGAASLPIGPDLPMTWTVFWLSPVVALVAGGAGLAFQKLTLGLRLRVKRSIVPLPAKLAIGAIFAAMLAVTAFSITGRLGVFGLGEGDMLAALQNKLVWQMALVLLVAKLLATALCYGTGGCGGIFAPIIFFGSMAGVVVHGIFAPWLGLTAQDQTLLALVGMTACLGAVVRAPLTSILIVMEMTWQIHVLPALMVAAVISVSLNRMCCATGNFYDAALAQDGIVIKD